MSTRYIILRATIIALCVCIGSWGGMRSAISVIEKRQAEADLRSSAFVLENTQRVGGRILRIIRHRESGRQFILFESGQAVPLTP